MKNIYCYGMISPSMVLSLAKGFPYPAPDKYAEIAETLESLGGEAANSAIVLARLGYHVVLYGCWIARAREAQVRGILQDRGVDTSALAIVESGGTNEYVIADTVSRTVFGNYASFHSGPRQWNRPSPELVKNADMVALDPYFRDDAEACARICVEEGVPYVSLDAPHDSFIAQHAGSIVISHELTDSRYPGENMERLFEAFCSSCRGLVIFTFGGRELWYAREGGPRKTFTPFKVETVDTTGAGDSFRGALLHGLLSSWSDEETVRFASAVAALVCTTRPHALGAPTIPQVEAFLAKNN